MIHSYDELYVAKAQTALAQMLLYGVEDLQIDLTEFWNMFLISGIADLFGKGDYRFIAGKSGDILDRMDSGLVSMVFGSEFL